MTRWDARFDRMWMVLLVSGGVALVVGTSWDRIRGQPFDLGVDQIALILVGLLASTSGLMLRRPSGRRLVRQARAAARRESESFIAHVTAHPVFYPRLGVWLGLIIGLTESAHLVLHTPGPFWPHALWLAPVVYGILCGLIGLAAMILGRRFSARSRIHFVLFICLTVGFAGWFFLHAPHLYVMASALLGLGLAWQASALLMQYPSVLSAAVRRSEAVLLVGVVAVAAWSFGSGAVRERRVSMAAPPAPEGARNVLLLVLDTVRAKSLSLFGYGRLTTPALERWATSKGVVFESAISTAPWTLPSHAGMFTGRWAGELSADWSTPLDTTYPTIAEVLRDRGYETAGFVGNLAYVSRGSGLARGFDHYEDFKVGFWQALLSTSIGRTLITGDWIRNVLGRHELVNRKVASAIDADFLSWLDEHPQRPFFAFINYFDAHQPYMPPEPYRHEFAPGVPEPRGPYHHDPNQADLADWWKMSASQMADEQALYDGTIAYLDHEIGELLDELDRRGLLDTTVVILTADHGENFGEHHLFGHGNSLYFSQIHVPLWILAPESPPGLRVSQSVSLRDLPNTILDLGRAGSESPFPGSSLARFWRGASPGDSTAMCFHVTGGFGPSITPLSRGDIESVVEDPIQYISGADSTVALYDYRADPEEEHNLTGSVAGKRLRRRFDRRLRACPRLKERSRPAG